jgi:hypothetical protein
MLLLMVVSHAIESNDSGDVSHSLFKPIRLSTDALCRPDVQRMFAKQ